MRARRTDKPDIGSEDDFQVELALEAARVGFWVREFNPDRLRLSPRAKEIYGFAPDYAMQAGDVLNVIHPEDRPRVEAEIAKRTQRRQRYEVEYRIVRPDGVVRWVAARGESTFRRDGRPRRRSGIVIDITERKRAEEALQTETRRLAALNRVGTALAGELDLARIAAILAESGAELCGAAVGAFYQTTDGVSFELSAASGAAADHLARVCSRRALLGSEGASAVVRIGDRADASGCAVSVSADASLRSYLAAPLDSRAGSTVGVVVFAHPEPGRFDDVTAGLLQALASQAAGAIENARLHRVLQRNEQRLSAIVNQVAVGVLQTDMSGRILFANQRFCDIVGRSREEIERLNVLDLTYPEDLRATAAIFTRPRVDGEVLEKRYLRPDGTIVWARNSISRVSEPAVGQPFYVGVSQDITASKIAEEALRRSEERYRWLVENTTEAVWRYELDEPVPITLPEDEQARRFFSLTRLVECNEGMARSHGFPNAAAILDKLLYELLPPEDPQNQASMQAFIRSGYRLIEVESVEADASGSRRYLSSNLVGIVKEGCVVGVWGTSRDISERKKAEEDLRRLNETLELRVAERTRQLADANAQLRAEIGERRHAEDALRQAQKIEAVGQLTGGVAHDFNNLLTAILGNIELVQKRVSKDEGAVRLLQGAFRAAERGARLTEQLLAFSRKQHLQPRPVDINALVAGMSDLLLRTIEANVRIATDLDQGLWPAMVDPNQIELVILNLAINARDAMPGGGTLTIHTENVTLQQPPAGSEMIPGDYVAIRVSDTGVGMSAAVLARAFEPFFTTKEVGKGSGLGLSMVYGVAKQSGGSVEIHSRPGAGTSVVVLLPRALQQPARETVEAKPVVPGPSDAAILVVDDDRDVRELTATCLSRLGYRVLEAENGGDALAALQRAGRIDLLLADLVMPGMNGIELARRARVSRPGLRVLFATGYADDTGFLADAGADPILKKPFKINELAETVSKVLGRAAAPSG